VPLVLHSFGPAFGAPDASPFCLKLQTFLELASIPYQWAAADLARVPKGKAPYVVLDGETLGDSELIMRRVERDRGIHLDAQLGPRERAAHHALAVMPEERTCHAAVFGRWHGPADWPVIRRAYFAALPGDAAEAIREGSMASLRAHGLGRHTREEIHALAAADLAALDAWLGERACMGGEHPRRLDCTAYALLAVILARPFVSPLRDAAQARPALVAYERRMAARLFPAYARAA
jgi:glutathione S-transferase